MLGVLVSWASFRFCGRRTLYKYGLLVLLCLLLVIGGLGFISNDNTSAQWAIGSMLLVYTFVYDFTVGPVCYAIVAEVSSTRLRPKTVVLARMVYNIFGVVNGIIVPRSKLSVSAISTLSRLLTLGFCSAQRDCMELGC